MNVGDKVKIKTGHLKDVESVITEDKGFGRYSIEYQGSTHTFFNFQLEVIADDKFRSVTKEVVDEAKAKMSEYTTKTFGQSSGTPEPQQEKTTECQHTNKVKTGFTTIYWVCKDCGYSWDI